MKRTRIIVVIVAVAALVLAGLVFLRVRAPEVEVTPARVGEAVELVYATGYVEAEEPVSVASRLTAPVMRVLVEEGDRVVAGQTLAILESSEQRALAAQAEAQRQGAILDERRKLALAEQGWVTRSARDQAVAAASAARAAARSAAARVGQTQIEAGISGVVLKRDVEPGDLATPSKTLFLLGDPARIRVTATVDEREVTRLKVGQSALMSTEAFPGRVIRGHLREITPGGDPNQRAFRLRLAVDEAGVLPIGLTLEVNIVTRRHPRALLVPASAVADGQVWVIDDGRAARRAVDTGIVGGDATEIVSGLKEGEQVIVAPPEGLKEGAQLRVVEKAARK